MSIPKVRSTADLFKIFPTTVDAVKAHTRQATEEATRCLNELFNRQEFDWHSVYRADEIATAFDVVSNAIWATSETHPDSAIRNAATECSTELKQFFVRNFTHSRQLYTVYKNVESAMSSGAVTLDVDQTYALQHAMSDFRRAGLDLPEDSFKEISEIEAELAAASTQFQTNIRECTSTVVVTAAELHGVSKETLHRTAMKEPGKEHLHAIGMDYPTYFDVMKCCTNAETRRRVYTAFNNRAYPENETVLKKIFKLRAKAAALTKFESAAARDIDSKMAKTPAAVKAFLSSLIPGLKQRFAKELPLLGVAESLLDSPGVLSPSDVQFKIDHYMKSNLQVDEQAIKEYFPVDSTVEALFDIYSKFFGIVFDAVPAAEIQAAEGAWHKDLRVIKLSRHDCDGEDGLLGYVVLDLFPREGKYSHACCCQIVPSVAPAAADVAKAARDPAVAVVLANFPENSADAPGLFEHHDVVTFFHEFGHAIHAIMGRACIPSLAGYNTKIDFVEMPSQMLEEWVWNPKTLRQISKHYKTGEPLPQELIDKKIAARTVFAGRDMLRQMSFATISLKLHEINLEAEGASDMHTLWAEVCEELFPAIAVNKDAHFLCAFGHICGYAASYYSYAYSEVFAKDVFNTILEADGLLDPEWGKKYVQHIIGRGGGCEPADLLTNFLGRAPDSRAFLKHLGIEQS